MNDKPRMLIIEDHPVMREGLACYFSETNRWQVTGKAANLDEAKSLLSDVMPDLLLLDIQLDDGWGIDIIPWLRKQKSAGETASGDFNNIPVMAVYSAFDDYAHVSAAIGAGVNVYICKRQNERELEEALVKALNGETFIDVCAQSKLQTVADLCSLLTKREAEILTMVKEGLSNKEIANKLGISYRTVENILCCVYDKTGVKSRIELYKL